MGMPGCHNHRGLGYPGDGPIRRQLLAMPGRGWSAGVFILAALVAMETLTRETSLTRP